MNVNCDIRNIFFCTLYFARDKKYRNTHKVYCDIGCSVTLLVLKTGIEPVRGVSPDGF